MKETDCGCYDGPYMEDSTIMVSVRCQQHSNVPAKQGHGLMERKGNKVKAVAPRDVHSPQAVTLAKQRRRNAERARLGSIHSTGNV